jgi:acetylglutamate kinase
MDDFISKADVLMEALPYFRRFYGKTFVIKYGGHAMTDEELKASFAQDIVLLKYVGINPVVVHGGGPQIDEVLDKMGITSRYVRGMRVTDQATMDIVEMVLVGKVNKEIVTLINQHGGMAVGLSGKDGGLILARKMNVTVSSDGEAPEIVDIGMVGEIVGINPLVIDSLDENKFIPVIAPVGVGASGETYNINADLVAGEIAEALHAEKLILMTDVEGVKDKKGELLSTLRVNQARRMIQEGIVGSGMIPKVECCVNALKGGVEKTHIIDGRIKHVVLLEIFTKEGVGTEVVRK